MYSVRKQKKILKRNNEFVKWAKVYKAMVKSNKAYKISRPGKVLHQV